MAAIGELLRAVPLFAGLSAPALEKAASTMQIRQASRGTVLFHQGDDASSAYAVSSGRLRLVQHTVDGKEVTMATFVPGDVIGLVMVLTNEPYPGTAEVLDDSVLITFQGAPLWDLLAGEAGFGVRMVSLLAERLYEAHNRIRELSAERVQQRVARSLVRLADKVGVAQPNGIRLDIRLSRQDLAQLNGTTLETISRTLSQWEAAGIISSGREQVTILRPHLLVRIADDLPA